MPNSRMIRVSSKGQIVLPKSFRERAGIANGDYIFVEEVDGILLIEKLAPSRLSQLAANLRRDVKDQGFMRQDLENAISEIRSRKSA